MQSQLNICHRPASPVGLMRQGSATAFLVLLILAFALRSPVLLALYLLTASGVFLANVRILSSLPHSERTLGLVLVGVLCLMLPVSVMRSETAIAHYVIALLSFGAALVMTRDLRLYLAASRWSLLFAQGAILLYLAIVGLDNYPLENLVRDSSSNGITSYLIILQANYCIALFLLSRRTALLTALVTLGICIVGYGRGSLLTSAGIVVFCILFHAAHKDRAGNLKHLLVIFCASIAVALFFLNEIVLFIELNTKLGGGVYDQARDQIIRDYLGRIDGWTLLFGANYQGTSIANEYFDNPHNSFIRAHHIFGLPYLILMALLPWLMLSQKNSLAVKTFCGVMVLLMLFRSATEPILFPTIFDFYYFAVCLTFAHRDRHTPLSAQDNKS